MDDPLASVPFNLEIEFEGGDLVAVARDLYVERLIAEPRQDLYGEGRGTDFWTFEKDSSIKGGGLIVSPTFRDRWNAWEQSNKVRDIVRRHGGRIRAARYIGQVKFNLCYLVQV
ncbi:hypothetical protein [Moorella sp. E306M]|uniref:hypothetical protein n=1 Tax=Moorella sp. E306M TaxID=2572683 RepID=UPI001144D212|nr:hypothetical protein [Moorella sp. E306M]